MRIGFLAFFVRKNSLMLLKNEKAKRRKGKKMILLRENEVKKFNSFDEAMDFFKLQQESDVWKRMPIKFLRVLPLPNNPICVRAIMEDNKISSSEEATLSAMEQTGLLLSYPNGKENMVLPIRSTGINSLKERAKLFGNSLMKMPVEKKAVTLNYGLELWKENALILIRDEQISAIHGGDVGDYAVLPMKSLLEVLQKVMERDFKGYKTKGIEVSHEMTSAELELPRELLSDFNKKLLKKGRKLIDGIPVLKFASSDVGTCGANLYPYISHGGTLIRIGDVLRLKHKSRAEISEFEGNCEKIFSIFKDAEKLGRLLDMPVKHPKECFMGVAKKCSLPKKAALEAAEEFDAFRPVECYAYDVYMGLWEIPRFHKVENGNQLLNLEENISRAMHLDYSLYDHKFELI